MKKKVSLPVIQLIGALLLAYFLFVILNPNKISFENLALGTETSLSQAKDDNGKLIHYLRLDSQELLSLAALTKSSSDSIILILGNSQTHSINQMKPNDRNYVEIIEEYLSEKERYSVISFSFPNANLQEFYLAFDYILNQNYPVKKLIFPIFMDDLRESGIRELFFTELVRKKYQIMDNSRISNEINKTLSARWKSVANENQIVLTTQEKSEKWLNEYLLNKLPIWGQRETMRGTLLNWLYMLRNTIFGIRPNSVRHIISEPYQKNLEALDAILQLAKNKGVRVYFYVPPIRSDGELPYDQSELLKFKNDINALATLNSANIKDFSAIVPGKFWGYKEPTNFIDSIEVDFMHFQSQGHRILADSLTQFISN